MDIESIAYECNDMAADCQRFKELIEARRAEVCKIEGRDTGNLNQTMAHAAAAIELAGRILGAAHYFANQLK